MSIYIKPGYPNVVFCDGIHSFLRMREGLRLLHDAHLVLEKDPSDPEHSFRVLKDRKTGETGIWVDDLYYKEY